MSTLDDIRDDAARCTACDLYKNATQTVFGEGPARARVMLVGEQPGDEEDLSGEPFVGPAGRLLDRALVQAGLDRGDLYVTNAVKHFKWIGRGKKRIHQEPSAREVRACKPWLTSEIAAIKPRFIVLMGATAAQSVFGAAFKVTQHRGDLVEENGERYFITVHPSSILRAQDAESRRVAMAAFVDDLRRLAALLYAERAATP